MGRQSLTIQFEGRIQTHGCRTEVYIESDCQIKGDLSFLLAAIFSKEWIVPEISILICFIIFL